MNLATFKKRFMAQFFPRWHMSLVLTATILAGLGFSRLLWWAGLHNITLRLALVLLLSYGCFILLIRLWLVYLTRSYQQGTQGSGGSFLQGGGFSTGSSGGGSSSGASPFQGGASGGGGAGGSFDAGEGPSPLPALVMSPDTSSSAGDAASSAAGEAVSGLGDSDGMLLVVVGLIVVAVLGSSIFIIYEAPAILSEAAFQLLLAGGLMKKAKQAQEADWLAGVWRHTWKPFAFTMLLTLAAAFMLGRYCPQATKISEVVRLCL